MTHRTKRHALAAWTLAFVLAATFLSAAEKPKTSNTSPSLPQIDIPYSKFVLPNGLTLLVHEDHKAPIVAVNIWYHVGSKNEKPGKTGFAHLYEHLMFNGSEHFNNDYFQAVEPLGATDLNGTTNEDRTNFFQTVPTSAVDTILWLESDRMGYMLPAVTQARLDEQRGVVQNEKRQGENEPYAISEELITKAMWPASHPYSHTVIGSMEDLTAASLDDVKNWFKDYYGAANAVIAVAGDITTAAAKEKVEKYFGSIPSGPPVAHVKGWVPERHGSQFETAGDRVPQARLYKVWTMPGFGTAEGDYLNLVSDILVGDKNSRLYKRLVYDDQIATSVQAFIDRREAASLFMIQATARPGDDLTKISKAIDEEMAKFLASGPTQEELDRVKTGYFANFVRGAERIGGFGGKSDILAEGLVYGGTPESYKLTLDRVRNATTSDLLKASKHWLADGDYNLSILPFGNPKNTASTVDRSKLPEPGAPPAPAFPEMKNATLSNGMKLIVAERHSVPVVDVNLLVDAGYAADQFAAPGTASLAMNMLDEGTKTRSSLQISKELATLGAQLSTGSNLDTSFVNLSALETNLDASLNLFADVVLNPSFPAEDFARLQRMQIAGIQREKAQPIQTALRVLPTLLYGKGHAYATPFTGSGTEQSVAALKRDDLAKFHETWFKPNNATIVVVGDTTMDEIRPKIEKLFASWKQGDVPKKNIGNVTVADKPAVYIVDKPGAQQSVIMAGEVAPPKNNPNEIGIEAMNTVLGGAFISRLNMNLREDKHWSYGAGSFLPGARGQRPFVAYAPVQTDKTKESLSEMQKELTQILKDKTITPSELQMAQSALTLTLPGSWETAGSVAGSIGELVQYNLAPDYYSTYAGKVKALVVNDLNTAAASVIHPTGLVWVVVGDRSKIEQGIRDLNIGPVHIMDADGNVLQ